MVAPTALTAYYLFFYYYYFGSNLNICNPKRLNMACKGVTTPSCVYYTGTNCTSPTGYCQKQVANHCEACAYPGRVDYRVGPCSSTELYSCLSADRTKTCDTTNKPVCGYTLIQRTGEVTYKNYTNACNACKASTVGFWTKGACWLKFTQTKNPDGSITKTPVLGQISLPALMDTNSYLTATSNVTWTSEDVGDSGFGLTVNVSKSGATEAKTYLRESIYRSLDVKTTPK